MKIILWIVNDPNQKALANKLHDVFPITAIVTETRQIKRRLTIRLVFEKILEKIFLPSVSKTWWKILEKYESDYQKYPNVDILDTENINSDLVYNYTEKHKPDLILVSGTRLIKEKMLSLNPTIGILNLHTGLSPYIKGGPNCTNWCIAKKDFHLIGNTVMWIDKGIDTGNILTTELTPLSGNENLFELHIKVMEHAHMLCISAIKFLANGKMQSVKQSDIGNGTTFYTKDWTLKQKFNLINNFSQLKKQYSIGKIYARQNEIKTIKIPNN